ncbi:hypothetical protein [Roseateles sp. YR242]|uniref:hypothetical protein n=1 Tax=Roseateles sp. YR242 TaxID=1855305 RepID=UPI0011607A1B|nr:hypothetical protein [Roseateles sp. YR242]
MTVVISREMAASTRKGSAPMKENEMTELELDEIAAVSGGMGRSANGATGTTPVNKGSGSNSCTDGIVGGMVGGFFGGLATGNPIGLFGVFAGATLAGAIAGGCFNYAGNRPIMAK